MQKKSITVTCAQCNTEFLIAPFRLMQGSGKYCSRPCRDAAQRGKPRPHLYKPPNRTCEVCGAAFRATPSAIRINGARFCSDECRWQASAKPIHIPDDERDLIYLAGFVDGEGTITVINSVNANTGNGSVHFRVMVANTHGPVMAWLEQTFGGRCHEPRKPRAAQHKAVIAWSVGAEPAVELCRRLLPYLKIKRRHAEIVLALSQLSYETRGPGRAGRYVSPTTRAARAPLLAELRSLNHRGHLQPLLF